MNGNNTDFKAGSSAGRPTVKKSRRYIRMRRKLSHADFGVVIAVIITLLILLLVGIYVFFNDVPLPVILNFL